MDFLFFSSFFPTEEAPNEHDAGRGWGGRRIGGPRGGRRRRPRCSRASVRTRRGPCAAGVCRCHSVAGQVVTGKRARLDPSTVTLLVFLHEAIPGGIQRESYEIIDAALAIEDD